MLKKHVKWEPVKDWKSQIPTDYAADLVDILYHSLRMVILNYFKCPPLKICRCTLYTEQL